MKKITKALLVLSSVALAGQAFAGNKDRTGQAGATELLINPWGVSSGLFGMNGSYVSGIEAMKCNIAGLSYTKGTELGLAHTIYLKGSNVSISNLGLAQKMGETGVIGFNIMSMSFGEIEVTTVNNPDPNEANIGSYKPQFLTFQLGFSKEFSTAIHAGIGATFVSEQVTNVHASGACFEGGVQYVTGARDNFHFGVTLRNVGTNMRFSGNGFAFNTPQPENPTGNPFTVNTPAEKFEMPAYLNFGISYDFFLDEKHLPSEDATPKHRLTPMASFTSNSFINDYLGGGIEYSYKETVMLRGGYRHEKNIGKEGSETIYKGFSAGATVQTGLGENGPLLALDYAYRPTVKPNNGVHTISIRISTRIKKKEAETTE